MRKHKWFKIKIIDICFKVNKDIPKTEICEHILKCLPKKIF